MQGSQLQEAIIKSFVEEDNNIVASAVPGSGKSTLLKLLVNRFIDMGIDPDEVKLIVFGKLNTLDLQAKLPTIYQSCVSTSHSYGWGLIKQWFDIRNTYKLIDANKYKWIAQNLGYIASKNQWKGSLSRDEAIDKDTDFLKILDLLRLCNLHSSIVDVEQIVTHFGLDGVYDLGLVSAAAHDCLVEGRKQAERVYKFDFVDQLWLPVVLKMGESNHFQTYSYVLCDEAQDFNALQIDMTKMMIGDRGKVLAVLDPKQSIMGFAGAMADSADQLTESLKAKTMPLSVCYRCPVSHINLRNQVIKDGLRIDPKEGAIEGSITQISTNEIFDHLKEGDLVISRKTSNLVNLCLKLISRSIPAKVKGRDIGEAIKKDFEEIANQQAFEFNLFPGFVERYRVAKIQKYQVLDTADELEKKLEDKLETLLVIYEANHEAKSIKDLCIAIDTLFSDDRSPITLMTCHKSKGSEANRVFLYDPKSLPMVWKNQIGWQYEQEMNLLNVALTRSKSELFLVGESNFWCENLDFESLVEPVDPYSHQIEYLEPSVNLANKEQENVLKKVIESSEAVLEQSVKAAESIPKNTRAVLEKLIGKFGKDQVHRWIDSI